MRYNALREKFLIHFRTYNKRNSRLVFRNDMDFSLRDSIERVVTNGFGYEPIRDKKEKVKSQEDLIKHLEKMDDRIIEKNYEFLKDTAFSLIRYVDNLENELNTKDKLVRKLAPHLDEIFEYIKDNKGPVFILNAF